MGKTKTITFKNSMFEAESATKVRTKELIPVMSGRTLTFDKTDNTVIAVYEYDESRTLLGLASEFRTDRTCTLRWNTCYILIMIKMNDGSNVSPTEVESKIGGGLSMCDRMIEFGKLADDSLFVKGRNFLLGTQKMTNNNDEVFARTGVYHDTESLFNGCATIESTGPWQGYKINFKRIAERCGIRAGDKVTYSIWTKFQGIPTHERCQFNFFRSNDAGLSIPTVRVFDKPKAQIVSGSWFQVKATFTVTEDDLEVGIMTIESIYYDADNSYSQVNSQVWLACPKLEYGNEATPYSPAPEDYVNRTCADYDLTV